MRRGLFCLAGLAAAALGSTVVRAAGPGDGSCVVRRPAAPVPRGVKPLLIEVPVPCGGDGALADRLGLVARADVSAPPTPVKPAHKPQLLYYGGPVISNVKVVALRWNGAVPAEHSARMEGFYRSFTGGAMFDMLSEYDTVGLTGAADGQPGTEQRIGHGSFTGTYTMTPAFDDAGPRISYTQVQIELAAHIAAGRIPAPELDAGGNARTLYMIDFPGTVTISLGRLRSCVELCAFHGSFLTNGARVAYAVLPAIAGGCLSGCGEHPDPFDVATLNASHELVEAVTDVAALEAPDLARPLAWYDGHFGGLGESADVCTGPPGELLDGYWVEKIWSNRWRACLVAPPPGTLP